tara:strand:- start:1338 stop:1550 length:213 start_codon:yes stop_codon:yes gene_type:complete
LPEALWFESRHDDGLGKSGIAISHGLGGWDVADRATQAPVVETIYPVEVAHSTRSRVLLLKLAQPLDLSR